MALSNKAIQAIAKAAKCQDTTNFDAWKALREFITSIARESNTDVHVLFNACGFE